MCVFSFSRSAKHVSRVVVNFSHLRPGCSSVEESQLSLCKPWVPAPAPGAKATASEYMKVWVTSGSSWYSLKAALVGECQSLVVDLISMSLIEVESIVLCNYSISLLKSLLPVFCLFLFWVVSLLPLWLICTTFLLSDFALFLIYWSFSDF